jgi:hypothetical protein
MLTLALILIILIFTVFLSFMFGADDVEIKKLAVRKRWFFRVSLFICVSAVWMICGMPVNVLFPIPLISAFLSEKTVNVMWK